MSKYTFAVPLLALFLADCGGGAGLQTLVAPVQSPVSRDQFLTAEIVYGGFTSAYADYRDACAARQIASSCRTVVNAIRPYGQKAQGAVIAARGFMARNQAGTTSPLFGEAIAAMTAYQSVQTQQGIGAK